MRKLLRVVGLLVYLVCVAIGLPLTLWLLFNAITFTGRSLAIVILVLIALSVMIALWLRIRTQRIFWGASLIVLVLIVIGFSAAIFPDEDHFLFFSQPDRVLDEVSVWLEEIREVP